MKTTRELEEEDKEILREVEAIEKVREKVASLFILIEIILISLCIVFFIGG